jgi:carboxyl-terminal processing protease
VEIRVTQSDGGTGGSSRSTGLRPAGGTEVSRPSSAAEWAERVWSTAKDGDLAGLERYLRDVPEGKATDDIRRLREAVEVLDRTRQDSALEKQRELDKALAELREQAAEDKLPEALTSAALAKLLSDDWNALLRTDDVASLLQRSDLKAIEAERSGDWLLAQELLFRNRMLLEGAERADDEARLNSALEKVNRRIGLLAQYAPHKLHDLRRLQAARLAPDKPFPEFNELGAEDWKDQLKGVTQRMLKAGLRHIAGEHIDDHGWYPLLVGGLDALRLLATTEALGENFPGLRDPEKVARWVATIDELRAAIDARPRRDLTVNDYTEVVGRLELADRDTIQLPAGVLYREFGEGATYQLAQEFEDQYTEIIWPERLRRFQQQTEGNFVGVGILIRQNEKREIVVVNPLEGSPAYRSGLKPDDRISAVDGESTLGWSLNRAVDRITGPRGKEVVLGVVRGEGPEEQILDVPIVRDTIKIRSVNGWWKRELDAEGNPQWDWLIDPHSRIGYVRLTGFNDDSFEDFLAAVDQMKASGRLNGLILDLRSNPGGLLKSAVQFSNLFIPRGTIVSGEDRTGATSFRHDAHPNRAEARLAILPTVVLINEASASASEIVAGALQAHGAAVIVGERTFGKGSVQEVRDISDGEDAAVKLTTQQYVLPALPGEKRGRLVHRKKGATDWGVNPDIVVSLTPQQADRASRLRAAADLVPGAESGDESDPSTIDDEAVAEPGTPREADEAGEADGAGDRATPKDRPRPDVTELLSKGLDPQLQTALLILQARAIKDLEEAAVARRM